MSAHEQDASLRYWKAAISALPAEKRDAAWEFYLEKFAGTTAGDTLSGLILLLEANGAFLLTLPATFQAELIQPLTEELAAIRKELHDHVESQRATLRALDTANERIESANRQFADTTIEFASNMSAAGRQIDVRALADRIIAELQSSITSPVQRALRDVPEQTKRIRAATDAAESSIKQWHALHADGVAFNAAVVTFVVTSVIFAIFWACFHSR